MCPASHCPFLHSFYKYDLIPCPVPGHCADSKNKVMMGPAFSVPWVGRGAVGKGGMTTVRLRASLLTPPRPDLGRYHLRSEPLWKVVSQEITDPALGLSLGPIHLSSV